MEKFYFTLDQKITSWYSVPISVTADSHEEAVKLLKERLNSAESDVELLDLIDGEEVEVMYGDGETINGSEEPLTPSENGGMSTIEVVDEDSMQIIFQNGVM
jgi:hypothetical protein